MDSLSTNVNKIQSTLHSSRRRLTTLETGVKKSAGKEVQDMGNSLRTSSAKIEHVSSQMRSYLAEIEYTTTGKPETTVNMNPQVRWLSKSLDSIVASLGEAHSSAGRALKVTEEYTYSVLDVGQTVQVQTTQLNECHSKAQGAMSQAQSSLSFSEQMLRETQARVSAKESEIWTKTREADEKRSKKTQLERDISFKQAEIARKERLRESKKEDVAAGAVLTGIGIMAAPFTLGLSLALAAGAATYTGIRASEVSDLKDDLTTLNNSIRSINIDIARGDAAVASLEQEKRDLQALVQKYKTEISERRTKHRDYQKTISDSNRVQGDVKLLKNVADSTLSNVKDDTRELQKMKQTLEKFSDEIQAKSVDVSTSAGPVERLARLVAPRSVSTNMRLAREYKKQQEVIQEVTETLARIQKDIPLLMSSHETKFLDIKPWNAVESSVVELGEDIPEVCYFPDAKKAGKKDDDERENKCE
ncbi:hypothetical protein B0H63DRAFT_255503 [Podospora didyma]|uniref:Uncharacterized protein n=1 Tax=Podospora didyma TaxID=330526 RepID=A0AAE0KD80_9PEZI|nr:hypothetical protein B0H63DRAFT_255503 [Podospora didyma]